MTMYSHRLEENYMPTLNWIGKEKVVNHHLDVSFRTLDKCYSYGEGDNGNMIIHGDNLDALKALLPMYEGRVKCIYIDPPYNTGNEGWVYNDNVNDPKIRKWLGDVVGKEGEDLSRHDKWLCMMYPRLKLLQKLLADNGAIFISMDDSEIANLKILCDEIFGTNNYVETIVWQKRTSPDARKKISNGHEYIIIYAKNINTESEIFNLLSLEGEDAAKFKNPDNDPRGPWVSSDFTAQGFRPNQMYTITTPSGLEMSPPEGRCWRHLEEVYTQLLSEGRLWFGSDGCGVPRKKTYLSEKEGKGVWTWWPNADVGHTQEATQETAAILGKAVFDYPKPVRLIKRIIKLASDPDSIILDSFAGSGSTAHAVLSANKEDGGNRRFILIEMEDYADNITAKRIKHVINGYGEGSKTVEGTGGNFSFYELGAPLMINGQINTAVPVERIREYVYYTETKQPLTTANEHEPYLLGVHNEAAYYFYYECSSATLLDDAFLRTIKTRAESYIIYADQCMLDDGIMEKYHITFKKIPRDITML